MDRSIRSLTLLALSIALIASGCAKKKDESAPAAVSNGNPMLPVVTANPPELVEALPPSETLKDKKPETLPPVLPSETLKGKDQGPAEEPPPLPQKKPSLPGLKVPVRTQQIARNVKINCKNNICDPSVGLLTFLTIEGDNDHWGASQCTASLIGSDVLATNGHCIPADLAAPGADCQGRIWITFADDPAHPEYEHQIGCSKVLFHHKDNSFNGDDYAYLKLEKASSRPALRQSRAGFENKTSYEIRKFNPVRVQDENENTTGIGGYFEKVSCLSLYESAVFSAPLDNLSRTNLFVDCRVIPGNSGSPIVAADGTVRGVIYAFLDKNLIRPVFAMNGSTVPEAQDLANLNLGSNFACLTEPGDAEGRNLPPACANFSERLKLKRAQADALVAEKLRPDAEKLIRSNGGAAIDEISAFGWSLQTARTEQLGYVGLGIPACARPAEVTELLRHDSEIKRPHFYVRGTYDKYLRASNLSLVWAGFSQTPETLHVEDAGGAYNVLIANIDTGRTAFALPSMSPCKP
ncbi:MAG TPA: trypsin-like serine protease [Bdellovibrionota bacterium]